MSRQHSPGYGETPARTESRTRRDPSEDEVHRVAPQDFARTVQRLTGGGASSPAPSTTPSSSRSSLPVPDLVASAATLTPRPASTCLARAAAAALSVPAPTARSMQEAYLEWCTSNNVVVSPGTMAEIERRGCSFSSEQELLRAAIGFHQSRNYSIADVPDFLDAIRLGEAVGPYESRVLPLFRELPSPRVPVACVVGVGVDTPEMLAYARDDFDVAPRMDMGDGDGLVNLKSLIAVDPAWRRPGVPFRMVKVRNVSHTGLLVDDRALAIIVNTILLPN
ncbi:hypothetical protein ACP70R_019722 [Stipagrostis hirtigluma subsp. patula]